LENTNEAVVRIEPTEAIEETTNDGYEDISHESKFILKVRGGNSKTPDPDRKPTDPVGLSRSILHVLESNPHGYCKLHSVGPTALSSALAGFRLASISYSSRTKGTVLVMTQSEYTATVAGNKTRGVCTRIFPMPVAYQL
jgi:hypothetical protein